MAEANRLTADARRGTDDRLIQANARVTELERENARLAKTAAAPVATTPRTQAAELPGDTPVYPATAARPAYGRPTGSARGWFDWR